MLFSHYLKGLEYFTSVVTFRPVSIFKNAINAALSAAEIFNDLGCPPGCYEQIEKLLFDMQ